MPNRPKFVRVLKWINEEREKLGLKPIKELLPGKVCSSKHCALANSLGGNGDGKIMVGVSMFTMGTRWTNLPKCALDFRRKFDEGKYPWIVVE